jgi:hypothetical protein
LLAGPIGYHGWDSARKRRTKQTGNVVSFLELLLCILSYLEITKNSHLARDVGISL